MKIKHKITGLFTLACMALNLFPSCSFFNSLNEPEIDSSVKITSLSMAKTSLETKVGSMEYISVSVKPAASQKEVKLSWSYDSSIIECDTSSAWGITVKGLAEGQTTLRCSYGG